MYDRSVGRLAEHLQETSNLQNVRALPDSVPSFFNVAAFQPPGHVVLDAVDAVVPPTVALQKGLSPFRPLGVVAVLVRPAVRRVVVRLGVDVKLLPAVHVHDPEEHGAGEQRFGDGVPHAVNFHAVEGLGVDDNHFFFCLCAL